MIQDYLTAPFDREPEAWVELLGRYPGSEASLRAGLERKGFPNGRRCVTAERNEFYGTGFDNLKFDEAEALGLN